MIIEISMAIIAIMLILLVVILIRLSFQVKQSIQDLQRDMSRLLTSVNEFVQNDLHPLSEEANHLVNNLNNKSNSLNFLFKPLSFLNSQFSEDSSSKSDTIPQIFKWIASSALLFKTTREVIKKYGK